MKRFETRSVSNFDRHTFLKKGNILNIIDLANHLETLKKKSEKGFALVIHLSALSLGRQHATYKALATSCASSFVQETKRLGQVFMTNSGDLLLLCEKITPEECRKLALRIRSLFSEDGGLLSEKGKAPSFYELYNLSHQYALFRLLLENLVKQETSSDPYDSSSWIKYNDGHTVPLNPENLKVVETNLKFTNLNSFLQGQFICKCSSGREMLPIARELYISISQLNRTLCPDIDLLSDPWLFRYLTYLLDKKVLESLSSDRSSDCLQESGIFLNMNVSNILSKEFHAFDSSLSETEKPKVTLELDKVDVFTDMGAFLYARDWLKERGYRIFLDGLTYLTLPYIDWRRLDLDGLKLFWSGEFLNIETTEYIQEIWNTKGKKKLGSSVILARCEEPSALLWGQQQGIEYFQGWHVDKHFMPGFQESQNQTD